MNWKKYLKTLTNKKVMVSLFLAGIMIFSMFGYVLSYGADKKQNVEYNEYEFKYLQNGVQTKINGKKINFNYLPSQLEDIDLPLQAKTILQNLKVISVTFDTASEYSELMAKIQFDMSNKLSETSEIYVQRGLLNNTDYDLPEITCKNVTQFVPVLELREGNETKITFDNGCIIAESDTENDFIRLNDRLVYSILQVME